MSDLAAIITAPTLAYDNSVTPDEMRSNTSKQYHPVSGRHGARAIELWPIEVKVTDDDEQDSNTVSLTLEVVP